MVDNLLTPSIRKRVKGKLPLKRELVDWSMEKLLQFVKFIEFFTHEGSFVIDRNEIGNAVSRAKDEPFWDEFITRIDMEAKHTPIDVVRKRFYTFARVPLNWIKQNPYALTEEMLVIMENNPRMAWASKNFELIETDMGTKVVERTLNEETDPNRMNRDPKASTPKTPVEQFENAKISLMSLMSMLSSNIRANEIKNMDTIDKLRAFDKMLNTANKILGNKTPSSVIFQQINVNKAKREELEESYLKYTKTQ